MATVIDPRIRARRVAVRREEGRRRLRRLLWLAGVAAAVVVGVAITRSPLLDIDHIRVSGIGHTTEAEIVAASGIAVGGPMTSADLDAVRSGIASLPWVADVAVKRSWPGTIHLEVTEREPVAAVASSASTWTVLDHEGRVLAVNAAIPPDLPHIEHDLDTPVPGTVVPELVAVLTFADALSSDLVAWIDRLVPGSGDAVELALVGGATAHAAGRDIDAELTALATILTRVELTCVDRIDLGVSLAPAVHRDPGCEEASDADAST